MIAPALTAGHYLRLRREAAGLSIDDVALMLADTEVQRPYQREFLTLLEAEACPLKDEQLRALCGAFRFDVFVFRQLLAGLGSPRICRACGCSDLDACDTDEAGRCAWSTHRLDLCTHCATSAASAVDAAPTERNHA